LNKIIGIGEYAVADNRKTKTMKTFALASCVAVIAYSPIKKAAGMVHVALPSPLRDEDNKKPGYYATTGIPNMIAKLCKEYGCERKELTISIYGGADSINENDVFNIGSRNIDAVKKTLYDMNMTVQRKEIGGTISRTIEILLETGNIKMTTAPITI